MVTSLMTSKPAREAGYEMLQYVAGRVQADAGGAAVNVKIGTVPQGAIITTVISRIATVFSGGTPALVLGTASGGSQIVSAIAETTAGTEQLVPLSSLVMPLTADTDVWAGLSGSATAGDGYITVLFVKPVA